MINWKYIKGFNEDTQAASDKKPLYTFINFKHFIAGNTFECMPSIFYTLINNPSGGTTSDFDAGHIITQSALQQHIDTAFTFLSSLIIRSSDSTNTVENNSLHCERKARFFNDVFSIRNTDPSFTLQQSDYNNNQVRLHLYTESGVLGFNFNDTDLNPFEFTSDGHFHTTGHITVGGDIEAGGKCEANYFNAKSDRRAKDNLKILNFKALDLINHTNLYSFTYKDTNTPSIGIIAQDVQNINIEGFKLVDNENATGEDMDYMSIHESKLVYILWQAIKEQQKEIEELKKRLN